MKRRFFLEDTGRFFPPHSPQPGKDKSILFGCDLSVTSSFSFLITEKVDLMQRKCHNIEKSKNMQMGQII
jgi:hypothetical protein